MSLTGQLGYACTLITKVGHFLPMWYKISPILQSSWLVQIKQSVGNFPARRTTIYTGFNWLCSKILYLHISFINSFTPSPKKNSPKTQNSFCKILTIKWIVLWKCSTKEVLDFVGSFKSYLPWLVLIQEWNN